MALRSIDNDKPIRKDVDGSPVFIKPMNQGDIERLAASVSRLQEPDRMGKVFDTLCELLAEWIVRVENVNGAGSVITTKEDILKLLRRLPDEQFKAVQSAVFSANQLTREERANLPSASESPPTRTPTASAQNHATDTPPTAEGNASRKSDGLPAAGRAAQVSR